jgi:hypothetical protein
MCSFRQRAQWRLHESEHNKSGFVYRAKAAIEGSKCPGLQHSRGRTRRLFLDIEAKKTSALGGLFYRRQGCFDDSTEAGTEAGALLRSARRVKDSFMSDSSMGNPEWLFYAVNHLDWTEMSLTSRRNATRI